MSQQEVLSYQTTGGDYTGPRVKDTDTFVMKAKWRHGERYNYSQAFYKSSKDVIIIVCDVHGAFEQRPGTHLQGEGCRKCQYEGNSKTLRMSREEFITRASEVHNNRYDYTKVIYRTKEDKVSIICNLHGEFQQRAGSHLQGRGCLACKYAEHGENTSTPFFEIVERANKVHKGRYLYPEQESKTYKDKIEIVCKEHGTFYQTPGNHIGLSQGCPSCGSESRSRLLRSTTEEFIESASEVHGDRYDYSYVEYLTNTDKVEIGCHLHGIFLQAPDSHLSGHGCIECSKITVADSHRYDTDVFISKSKEVHGDKYTYELVDYNSSTEKVIITCSEHGDFEQAPSAHLSGQGCKLCGNSRKSFGRGPIYRSLTEESYIYLIQLSNANERLLKIGLSVKPSVRHSKIEADSGYKVEVLRCHKTIGAAAYDLEKSILHSSSFSKYTPQFKFQGYSECFEIDNLELLNELLEVCFEL